MSIRAYIPDNIRRAAKVIGLAAWLGEPETWVNAMGVIEARLTVPQRKALTYATLRTLDKDAFNDVMASIYGPQLGEIAPADGTHPPIAPLFSHMDEAALWADMAEPEALEAYCLSSFKTMSAPRKAAFLEFVQGRQAA